jgi:hypothetical protein
MSPRVTVMSPQTEAARRRPGSAPPVAELADQTEVGEVYVRALVRAQLLLALRVAAVFVVLVAGLPLLFTLVPATGRAEVGGVGLPWVLLGLAAFPLLTLLGVVYVRQAERNERDFEALVDRG